MSLLGLVEAVLDRVLGRPEPEPDEVLEEQRAYARWLLQQPTPGPAPLTRPVVWTGAEHVLTGGEHRAAVADGSEGIYRGDEWRPEAGAR